jgi:CheY-like chemotaxis protein
MKKAHAVGAPESIGGSADILVVEDDSKDAELTLSALEECGFGDRVEHLNDGDEALDYIAGTGIFARQPPRLPRLILLDLGLHKTGGLQVLRQLKSDERTKGIPIVVLTGSKLTIEVVESYRLGVNSYVIKPTSAREFAKVVAAIGNYWLQTNEPPPG